MRWWLPQRRAYSHSFSDTVNFVSSIPARLVRFIQVVLDLLWRQHRELAVAHHAHFDVVACHFSLEAFAQRQQSRVYRIFQLHLFRKALLQKVLGIHENSLPIIIQQLCLRYFLKVSIHKVRYVVIIIIVICRWHGSSSTGGTTLGSHGILQLRDIIHAQL